MLKTLSLLLALVLVVAVSLTVMEQTITKKPFVLSSVFSKPAPPQEKDLEVKTVPAPDRLGETIIYDVVMGMFRLGSATFHYAARTELDQKPVDLLTFTTKLARFSDSERIFADPETFLPLRVERTVRAWPKYEEITEQYDQKNFTLTVVKRAGGRVSDLNFKKDSAIHNAILLPYVVRRVPELKTGWMFDVNLPTQAFVITFIGIEEVTVPAGTFKAYHFQSTPERFEIWISADDKKIPLKIKGSSGLGYTLAMRAYSVEPPL